MGASTYPVCVALDFETAGYYKHSACSIGLVRIEGDEIGDEFSSLIRPPSPDVKFTHIHGLRWKDLKDAEKFPEVWQTCLEFLDGAQYLIAHNARFDRGVLYACCDEYGCERPTQPFLCTMKGSRKVLSVSSHRLNALCDYFGIELDHHNALSDARACARLFLKLRKRGADLTHVKL